MFRPHTTAASRKRAACSVSVPSVTRSPTVWARATYLRMLTLQCSRVTSGITAWRRSPPGRDASTNGLLRSSRRPEILSMCSTRSRTWVSVRIVGVNSETPARATKTCDGRLIQISSTSGSSMYCWSGPKPATLESTLRAASALLATGVTVPLSAWLSHSVSTSSTSAFTTSPSRTGSTPRRRISSRTRDSTRITGSTPIRRR